jgi:hypothetical protein
MRGEKKRSSGGIHGEVQGGKDLQEHEDVRIDRYRLSVCAQLEHGSRCGSPRGGEVNRGRSFVNERG